MPHRPTVLTHAPPPFAGTEIHTLSNGLTVIFKQDPAVPVVAMQAWVRCGAIDEAPAIYGISHGLEHMVFKGTPTRSAGEISSLIEAKGGAMNAATQMETTHYYIDVPSYGAEKALDVLCDTILHPTFPQEELERERLVILEEIHRRDDSPDATLWDEFAATVFKNTPYGIKVIGSIDTVSAMSRDDLNKYFKAHYVPSKMTMVLAGDFEKKKTLKQLERAFKNLKPAAAPAAPTVHLGHIPVTETTLRRPVQLSYLALGFPTIGFAHEDLIPLDILADILGGSVSSRLYQRLREEKQAALTISCDYMAFQQAGLFAIFAETLPGRVDQLKEEIFKELAAVKNAPITAEELARAQARIKSEWLFGAETPHGRANSLGSLHIIGQIELINTYMDRINSLTPHDLMNVYEKYLSNRQYFQTLLTPENAN